MKRNFILSTLSFLLAVLIGMPALAIDINQQKKEKKKKEKKEFVWDWDGKKTGVKEIDDYLLGCDSLVTGIKDFKKSISNYKYYDLTIHADGKDYLAIYMVDTVTNTLLSPGLVNWQFAESAGAVTLLTLTSTTLALQTTSATMALPKLGLNALSYGKYIKAGPIIIAKAKKEFDVIRTNYALTRRQYLIPRKEAIPMDQFSPELKSALMIAFEMADDETFEKYFKKHIVVIDKKQVASEEVVTENVIVELSQEEKKKIAQSVKTLEPVDLEEGQKEPEVDLDYLSAL